MLFNYRVSAFFIFFSLSAFQLCAGLLPYPSPLPSVTQSYDSILLRTWQGIKKRNIDAYTIPLVHRPKSETPHDAVSEGVGYGLLCALYCNDQAYFNKIWDAGEQYMWTGNSYNWRVDRDGKTQGEGAASDAEEDIACALIFADMLVKKTIWQAHSGPKNVTYAARAKSILENIWTNMVEDGKYLRPGNLWGGKGFVNPGYFSPAYYRVFDAFDTTSRNWTGLIDQCYTTLGLSPGFKNGLAPDWMKGDGGFTDGGLGYNAYGNGQYFYKDAIRVLWRCAIDYLWYGEPRAKTLLDNAMGFIKTADRANFYKMDGTLLTDTFSINSQVRNRTEHSHLTIGMWATAAMASKGKAVADSFSAELLKFYTPGDDFFGKASDPAGEDTLHNEMYFDQFLAWFGAALISGVFTNVWEDLSDPNFSLPVEWKTKPTFSCVNFDANVRPLKISGVFTKSARWSVVFTQRDGDSVTQINGVGETLNVSWYGMSASSQPFAPGWYDVTVSARALKEEIIDTCWLERPLDLKMGNRVIADNFYDGDLVPFLGGTWRNYLDSYEGKSGKSTVPFFGVEGQDTSKYLRWSFLLNGGSSLGYNPYAALEWNCQTSKDSAKFVGVDTITIIAKSLSPLGVSVQLVTSDITDYNFYEDSVSLSTQWQEFRMPIKNFKHRFSGGTNAVMMSKLTAIRFQVQNKDNTTNDIQLKAMLFSGNISALYKSPPPAVSMPIGIRWNKEKHGAFQRVTVQSRGSSGFEFTLPSSFDKGTLRIINCKGTELRKLDISSTSIQWDGFDKGTTPVRSGMYFAVFSGRDGKSIRMQLPVIKK
jgi:endo-1,4-beta-D-glucanase Y